MPNLHVWRPADGNETSAAYLTALTSKQTPSIIALTRQVIPQLPTSTIEKACKGGYVVLECQNASFTLVSSGSEVSICLAAAHILNKQYHVDVRVVSMPCTEIFDIQPLEYQISVLKPDHPIMSVEALATQGWEKYSHAQFGIKRFGESGPCDEVFEKFQMTVAGIVERALKTIRFYQGTGRIRSHSVAS